MRERIRQVMRYAGPRMIIYDPKTAFWHMLCSIKEIATYWRCKKNEKNISAK